MDRFQPAMALLLRTLLGLLLSLALGITGEGIGWILFVFFGATSHEALLTLMMGGSAVGAAAGSLLAWLRLDRNSASLLLTTALLLLAAAVAGAWGGLKFGANQEVPCCAEPAIGPMTYTVMGSVIVTNAVALFLGVFQSIRQMKVYQIPARRGPSPR